MEELVGLTWDCVDVSDESISEGRASLTVNKELQRVRRDVLESLEKKDVILVFPSENSKTKTVKEMMQGAGYNKPALCMKSKDILIKTLC